MFDREKRQPRERGDFKRDSARAGRAVSDVFEQVAFPNTADGKVRLSELREGTPARAGCACGRTCAKHGFRARLFLMRPLWKVMAGSLFSWLMCAVSVPSQAQTWTATSAPSNSWGAVTCSANGSHVAAAAGRGIASTGRIYISSDGGTNWSATSAPTLTWYAIASSADGSNLIAAAYLNGIYTSADGGATWRSNAINTVPSPTTWRAVAASADGTVLFAMPSGNDLMYRSTNAGASWLSSTSHLADTASIAVSADGAFVLGGDNSGHVANSTNSGATWGTNTSIGGYCGGVTVSPQGRRLLAATSTGGIFLSSNRGASWSNTGLPANAVWVGVASF